MTYCLGILLEDGLVFASDSRTNAGVDQIASVRKLDIFQDGVSRVIVMLSAGNLATTQAIVSQLRQGFGSGNFASDLQAVPTLFDAAQLVGNMLRGVIEREGGYVKPFGNPNATFILGGQITGGPHGLFEIYSAGNFIEAGPRNQFVQTGETKYGKPILDRTLAYGTGLIEAAKLALISFDATIRSNITVAPPIDMLCYRRDSFASNAQISLTDSDAYMAQLRDAFGNGLIDLTRGLPEPPITLG